MLSTLRNAWKVPELRKRILFTIFLIALYRLGIFIRVPGIDQSQIANLQKAATGGTLFGFYNLISGGALEQYSIFANGVVPYINASIIIQLLTIAIPQLEQLEKEGEDGRKKIEKITRYSAVAFAALQAFTQYMIIRQYNVLTNITPLQVFTIIFSMTVASTYLMWLGDRITDKGIGNGISLLIFINIISRFPTIIYKLYNIQQTSNNVSFIQILLLIAVVVAVFVAVVVTTLAERRIPVQYAGRTVGNKTFKGQSTHIPINVNNSGVIAIIFALSVLQTPVVIAQFFPKSKFAQVITGSNFSPFKTDTWTYVIVSFVLIIFFTWFYTLITFKPDEMAENIHKSAGFIPGIRPGEPTENYLEKVIGRISILGGIFIALISVLPTILDIETPFQGLEFGGTSFLIVVGVALETMRQIQAQLVMRHYQGFLR